ncbi:hypothetical protein ACQEU8_35760 [Streptomyces sp. CA-250714]|uniref:hypothetical protein n=1 Tax=Streptomyces sp. CA-250714 TaxID=3240060 RepID=UPI003D8E6099
MDYRSKARRAWLRLVALGVAVAAIVVGGGVLAVNSAGDSASSAPRTKPSSGRSKANGPAPGGKRYTPATARSARIVKPRSAKNGIGIDFPHTAVGATSAAVSYWTDLSYIDDQAAERQLRTIAVSPSDPVVRDMVSSVRKLRESVGLPPSGGPPNEITFTTQVKAVQARSLDSQGNVIGVWMNFDRYATIPDKESGGPLKDQQDYLIVTWRDGDWKVTQAPEWERKLPEPRSYDPDSFAAFEDGWREVTNV